MYWETEFNPPHRVISKKTNWPEKKLDLLHHSPGHIYHKIQKTVNKGRKHYYLNEKL